MEFQLHLATLEFSLFICNETDFLTFFDSSTRKILKIDLEKEKNFISSYNLHLGVGTARAINKFTTTQALEVRKFKQNSRRFFIRLVKKLKEQSSLRCKYTHYISRLSPNQIVSSKDEFLINLFSKLYLLPNEQGWITTLCPDHSEASYKLFIANADMKNQLIEFDMDESLDVFYMTCLSHHVELREVV